MKTRKKLLKLLLLIWLLIVAAGIVSYYFGTHVSKTPYYPIEITINITVILFSLCSLYLLKIKSYFYYNKLTTFFFSFYFTGGVYLSIITFDSSGVISYISSISFGIVKLFIPVLFWSILHIPGKTLVRYNRMYLKN